MKKYLNIEEIEADIIGPLKTRKIIICRGEKYIEDPQMLELKDHQKDLINAIGIVENETIDISSKQNNHMKIYMLPEKIYSNLTNQGYFPHNPEKIRTTFLVIGFAITFFTLFIPGILLMAISFFISKKTLKGIEIKRHAIGLRQFLSSQDRQFQFQEENSYMFEKLLPYAIVFGVAKIWAKNLKNYIITNQNGIHQILNRILILILWLIPYRQV